MSDQEYACAIVVIVQASSLEQARAKLARQVPVSYKIMAIEPMDVGALQAEDGPGWPGSPGQYVLDEDAPWRGGGVRPGE